MKFNNCVGVKRKMALDIPLQFHILRDGKISMKIAFNTEKKVLKQRISMKYLFPRF